MPLDRSAILVVAATAGELAPTDGWRTLVCGVGPVEAAARTAAAIAAQRPAAILHVGIAGARRAAALAPASLVIGREAVYADLGVSAQWAPNTVAADARLVAAAQRLLPDVPTLSIGTSARIGGTERTMVEAMEGFAVLRAAEHVGVPALEVRAISNAIEETDRAQWHIAAACQAIITVTPALIDALRDALDRG